MKITLESTDKIVTLKTQAGAEMPARIWQGETESGIPFHAFITRLAVHKDEDQSQFDEELQTCADARPEVQAWPFHFFID